MVVLRLPGFWTNWNLELLVFVERGKPLYPETNPDMGARIEPTINSINPRVWCRRRDLNQGHMGLLEGECSHDYVAAVSVRHNLSRFR